ncbi:MAG: hypothetical protein IPK71_29520 [Myxococcales bacterium]|nr:hypothetical protein [Myxococcales bacterium]
MDHKEHHYTALWVDERGLPHVGTGAEGRVYTVDDTHAVTLEVDTDERSVGAVMIANGKGFVATSDPPVLHRVLGQGGGEAVDEQGPRHDPAGTLREALARHGPPRVSTRTGNTQTPDGTWSAWSAGQTRTFGVSSPMGRYVQVRARFVDPRATLTDVTLPFVTENVRPVVLDERGPQERARQRASRRHRGLGRRDPEARRDREDLVEGRQPRLRRAPLPRLVPQRKARARSTTLTKPDETFTKTELEWDTQAIPEGKYRVRVEASDDPNGPSRRAEARQRERRLHHRQHPPQIADLPARGSSAPPARSRHGVERRPGRGRVRRAHRVPPREPPRRHLRLVRRGHRRGHRFPSCRPAPTS